MGIKDSYDFTALSSKHYKKSNALINSKGRANLLAQKLFAIGIQQAVEDEKTGILTSTMYGTDLRKIFGAKGGSFYDKIKLLVNPTKNKPSLLDWRVIFTDDVNQRIEAINVITDCSFENGVLEIRYNDKVNKQIKDLQANYTVLSLTETIPLNSIYSFKLYEILKSEYDKQEYIMKKQETWKPDDVYVYEINIIDLKLRLGIIDATISIDITNELKQTNPNYGKIEELTEKLLEKLPDEQKKEYIKYKRYDNFKRSALEVPKKELAEKTSIFFEYDVIRTGKGGKATAIRFFIHKKKQNINTEPKKILSEDEKYEFLDLIFDICEGKIKRTKDRITIAEAANYNIQIIKDKYAIAKNQNITNLVGWMIAAINNDYSPAVHTIKSTKSFVENDFSYDAMESVLLDNIS